MMTRKVQGERKVDEVGEEEEEAEEEAEDEEVKA